MWQLDWSKLAEVLTYNAKQPMIFRCLAHVQIHPHRFFIGTGRPDHFGQHHQVVDVLGIDAEHILVGVRVRCLTIWR